MNKKRNAYALFTLIATLFAMISASLITVFAILRSHSSNNYPTFSYEQYKDCSISKKFDENEGPQLYEAEEMVLSSQIRIEGNIYASNKEALGHFIKGETITLEVDSSSSVMAMVSLSCSYVSESGRSVDASSLFGFSFNDAAIDLGQRVIQANFNHYDFKENDLVPIHLFPGKNTLVFSSLGDYLKIGYVALRSNTSNVSSSPIGPRKVVYEECESRQYYSSYLSQLNGPVIVSDEQAREKHSAFFSNPYDSLTFYIDSSTAKKTQAGIILRLARENMQPDFEIYLNNSLVDFKDDILTSSYQEFTLGELSLLQGENTLTLRDINGSFYFDSFILNQDITHSPSKHQERYEAEKADLTHGGQIASNSKASSYYVVNNITIDSYVEFEITSLVEDEVHLFINLSYIGHSQASDSVFGLSLNGKEIDTSMYEITNTGGYSNYTNLYLGKIHLSSDKNTLELFSFTGNFNLDYLDLFHDGSSELEAEDGILDKGNYVEMNQKASHQKVVSNNINNSTLTMDLFVLEKRKVNLEMVFSYIGKDTDLSSFFTLRNNTSLIHINDVELKSTIRVSRYAKVVIGEINLEQGLNQIILSNLKSGLMIDQFILN